MHYFTLEEILELHFMIIEDYGGSHGVREESRLKSLVEASSMQVFGAEQYPEVCKKAAVYMRNCIADHMFTDGNKRTGTALAGIFMSRNGRNLTAKPSELEDFAVKVAVEHLEIDVITDWLQAHSKAS